MNERVLTFDCAETLIQVRWEPVELALDSAEAIGLSVDRVEAGSSYRRLLRRGWSEFCELNLTRDESQTNGFWERLTNVWLTECGVGLEWSQPLITEANRRLFGPESTVFSLFEDTVAALDALSAQGYRMAVLSNWDISLHKALRMFDLTKYFESAIASLEEGVEKPDPRIFEIALERLGTQPHHAVHIGDNPLDDLQGARNAGMRGILVDRGHAASNEVIVKSLLDLPDVL